MMPFNPAGRLGQESKCERKAFESRLEVFDPHPSHAAQYSATTDDIVLNIAARRSYVG